MVWQCQKLQQGLGGVKEEDHEGCPDRPDNLAESTGLSSAALEGEVEAERSSEGEDKREPFAELLTTFSPLVGRGLAQCAALGSEVEAERSSEGEYKQEPFADPLPTFSQAELARLEERLLQDVWCASDCSDLKREGLAVDLEGEDSEGDEGEGEDGDADAPEASMLRSALVLLSSEDGGRRVVGPLPRAPARARECSGRGKGTGEDGSAWRPGGPPPLRGAEAAGRRAAGRLERQALGGPSAVASNAHCFPGLSQFVDQNWVRLCGLRRWPELNGCRGVLVQCDSDQRWAVLLLPSGEVVRVRPCNVVFDAGNSVQPAAVRISLTDLMKDAHPYIIQCLDMEAARRLFKTSRGMRQVLNKGGRIYIIGGGYGAKFRSSAESFDLLTNTWRQLPKMRRPRACPASVVLDSCLYALGGIAFSSLVKDVERFNPYVGTWESMPPMSVGRYLASVVAHKGSILVCGGVHGSGDSQTDAVECLFPRSHQWKMMAPMSQARCCAMSGCIFAYFYVCGGVSNGALAACERFNFRSSKWEPIPPMSSCRGHAAYVAHAGDLYVCGGTSRPGFWGCNNDRTAGALDTAERFCHSDQRWDRLPQMQRRRCGATAAASATGRICVCGGDIHHAVSTETFNPTTSVWEALQHFSHHHPERFHAVAASGHLYIMGADDTADHTDRLDLETNLRKELPRMLDPRGFPGVAVSPPLGLGAAFLATS